MPTTQSESHGGKKKTEIPNTTGGEKYIKYTDTIDIMTSDESQKNEGFRIKFASSLHCTTE